MNALSLSLFLHLGLLSAAGLASPQPGAQEAPPPPPLEHYLSSEVGNLWWFEPVTQTGEPWVPWVLTVSETEEVLGRPVQRWEDSSGGYRQLIWSESEGLLLLGSHTFSGPTIYFDQPLVLIPPDYQLGTLHRAEADVRMAEGDSERTGTLTSELTASQTAPVSTPAGRFDDCLLVEVSFALETQEGTQELDLEVTLAAGVGPVLIKASGTAPHSNLALAEARVGETTHPSPD